MFTSKQVIFNKVRIQLDITITASVDLLEMMDIQKGNQRVIIVSQYNSYVWDSSLCSSRVNGI